MAEIANIEARQIADSRGEPTVEIKILSDDGLIAIASVPSGTSTGSHEAKSISASAAIENIHKIIKPKLLGFDPKRQQQIDKLILDLDGTPQKAKIGANAILAVSIGIAKLSAQISKQPLYMYLNNLFENFYGKKIEITIPTPMMVMFEGGKHGKNNLCIQEFLLISSLENGQKVWKQIKKNLEEKSILFELGLEGGFSPKNLNDNQTLELLMQSLKDQELEISDDTKIGVDIAGNNCRKDIEDITALFDKFPLYSLEDPCAEDDWKAWQKLNEKLNAKKREYLLIGDDFFTTNLNRLEKGINLAVANAIIIKINQIGTLTETLEVIARAKRANFTHIVSHRSGETMDNFITDLACATGAKFIKSGAPFASERAIKYERLKEIKSEITNH